jgi:hypothetical protein
MNDKYKYRVYGYALRKETLPSSDNLNGPNASSHFQAVSLCFVELPNAIKN